MSEYVCFLITVLHENALLRCALKIHRSLLKRDCFEYPMETENREQLHRLLPAHVACGSIVEIQEIFEVHQARSSDSPCPACERKNRLIGELYQMVSTASGIYKNNDLEQRVKDEGVL